jgi:RHS repeat-associated protein
LLSAVPDNVGTTAIGTPTTVTTTVIGENAERTFAGTAGQRLTLSVSGNTFTGGVDLLVRHPNGGSTVGSLAVFDATGFRDVFTLPVTGTYTMVVDPRDQQIGSLTFLLADAPAGVAPTAEQSDAPESTEADRAGRRAPEGVDDTAGVSVAAAAAAAVVPLTITAAELLANDRPGPENESTQTLTVTEVRAGPFTHGTVSFAAGIVAYTPDDDFVGNATIPYSVCDNGTTNGSPDPLCTTGAVSVKVTANHPPVVNPQTLSTVEDTPVDLTLTGSDPNGEAITFVVAEAPRRGTLGGPPPTLTYTPAPDANGIDTFTFRANDGKDHSLPATVTITVTEVNDPPVPQADRVTARAGDQVTVPAATLAANDAAGPFNERLQTLTVTGVTAGPDTHGSVTLDGGTVTFVPDTGFSGTAIVAYTVCDNGTTNGTAAPRCTDSTLSISANRRPVANDQSAQTSLTKPVAITVSATDPDGDPLTYTVTTPPEHGTLAGRAPELTYTAAPGFVGDDHFTFAAADAFGASAPATVSVTVNDVPSPTLGADSATVRTGRPALIDVLANDTPGGGTLDPSTLAVTAAPTKGTAVVVQSGQIRYTANAGTSGPDSFSYTVCDTGGGCATVIVTVQITENSAPAATDDTYDIAASGTLRPAAPGVLSNDTDPDSGETLQARLVQGVTNGRLLLNGNGAFTYVPNGPGVDTFVYRIVDSAGAVSNEATVTIYVTGPPGPPIVGNDMFQVQHGDELSVTAPGLLVNDYSPSPRLGLTVRLQRDTANGSLLLQPDGSFVYTPLPGYTGVDQFSYTVRDSEGRESREARVGITVTSGGPATATIAATNPGDGAVVFEPTLFTATLQPPPGENVTEWSVAYRRPGESTLVPLAAGTGTSIAATFDPTLVSNGTFLIVVRAVTSGGGVLVDDLGVIVDGDFKPGRYTTTFRDVALNSAHIPIELYRTYDSTSKAADEIGAGWSLELAHFRIESNGALGAGAWSRFTCGGFPFLATCYQSDKPHVVTVSWPDGHVERFRFEPNRGSTLIPTITTAGFVAEPGTTSRLEAIDDRLLLAGREFLAGDFFSADGIYDPIQYVLTTTDGTRYLLDRRDGLLEITDRNGNAVALGSDGIESSTGLSMTFVRDANHRITRIVGPAGNIDYTYSPAGDLVRVDYPDGTDQTFTYDGSHNLLTVSGGEQLVRTVEYDEDGRATAVTDASGQTFEIDADLGQRSEIVTSASGRLTTVSTYGVNGRLASTDEIFDGHSRRTTYSYDSVGRPTGTTSPMGRRDHLVYDAAGNVISITTPGDDTWTFSYNALNLPTTTTAPDGEVYESNTYDSRGNLLTTTTGDGAKVTNTYDDHGLLLTSTDAFGTTTYDYDENHLLVGETDPLGRTISYTYDAAGNVATFTAPGRGVTRYQWSPHGNLLESTNAEGSRQSFTWDELGRLTEKEDPLGRTTTYGYDIAGRLASITDREGDVTTYGYDADGYLSTVSYQDGDVVTIVNDPVGRRVSISDSDTVVERTFDDDDNVVTERTRGNGGVPLPDVTLTYGTDADENPTSIDGPGGHIGYRYDTRSRLVGVTDPLGGQFELSYDGADQLVGLVRPNGVNDTLSYRADALQARTATHAGTIVNTVQYGFDALRRRTSFTNLDGQTLLTHDDGNRLNAVDYPSASGLEDESFTYDDVGNRTAWNGSPPGAVQYDVADRLLSDGTYDYRYDLEGRLIQRTARASGAITTYDWNDAGQLTVVDLPDGSRSTYRYDALGRRVETDDDGTIRRFVYTGSDLHLEYDAANQLDAVFVVAPEEGTTLEVRHDGATTYPLYDGVNSAVAMTDDSGAMVGRTRHSVFGVPHSTGKVEHAISYAGHQYDEPTGLIYARSRYYDPTLGRFLSEDPEPTVNPYPYALNSPCDYVDPTGRSTTTETIKVNCKVVKNAAQAADALAKFQAYQGAKLVYATKAYHKAARYVAAPMQKTFRRIFQLNKRLDADHIIELVLGGDPFALHMADAKVNRSFGSQIGKALSKLRKAGKIARGDRVLVVPAGDCRKKGVIL